MVWHKLTVSFTVSHRHQLLWANEQFSLCMSLLLSSHLVHEIGEKCEINLKLNISSFWYLNFKIWILWDLHQMWKYKVALPTYGKNKILPSNSSLMAVYSTGFKCSTFIGIIWILADLSSTLLDLSRYTTEWSRNEPILYEKIPSVRLSRVLLSLPNTAVRVK